MPLPLSGLIAGDRRVVPARSRLPPPRLPPPSSAGLAAGAGAEEITTGPVEVIVRPSAETTISATESCPPVLGLNRKRRTTAPGAWPETFGKVNVAGLVRSSPTVLYRIDGPLSPAGMCCADSDGESSA